MNTSRKLHYAECLFSACLALVCNVLILYVYMQKKQWFIKSPLHKEHCFWVLWALTAQWRPNFSQKSNILEETKQDQFSKIPTKEKYNQIWLCGAKRNTRIPEYQNNCLEPDKLTLKRLMEIIFFPIKYDLHFLHNWCNTRYSICDILFYFHNNQSKHIFIGYKSKTRWG